MSDLISVATFALVLYAIGITISWKSIFGELFDLRRSHEKLIEDLKSTRNELRALKGEMEARTAELESCSKQLMEAWGILDQHGL